MMLVILILTVIVSQAARAAPGDELPPLVQEAVREAERTLDALEAELLEHSQRAADAVESAAVATMDAATATNKEVARVLVAQAERVAAALDAGEREGALGGVCAAQKRAQADSILDQGLLALDGCIQRVAQWADGARAEVRLASAEGAEALASGRRQVVACVPGRPAWVLPGPVAGCVRGAAARAEAKVRDAERRMDAAAGDAAGRVDAQAAAALCAFDAQADAFGRLREQEEAVYVPCRLTPAPQPPSDGQF